MRSELKSAHFRRAPGVLLEELAEAEWVAYSALSGETHLVNDTSAVVLRLLDESTTRSASDIAAVLAAETGTAEGDVSALLESAWETLIRSGLIRMSDLRE